MGESILDCLKFARDYWATHRFSEGVLEAAAGVQEQLDEAVEGPAVGFIQDHQRFFEDYVNPVVENRIFLGAAGLVAGTGKTLAMVPVGVADLLTETMKEGHSHGAIAAAKKGATEVFKGFVAGGKFLGEKAAQWTVYGLQGKDAFEKAGDLAATLTTAALLVTGGKNIVEGGAGLAGGVVDLVKGTKVQWVPVPIGDNMAVAVPVLSVPAVAFAPSLGQIAGGVAICPRVKLETPQGDKAVYRPTGRGHPNRLTPGERGAFADLEEGARGRPLASKLRERLRILEERIPDLKPGERKTIAEHVRKLADGVSQVSGGKEASREAVQSAMTDLDSLIQKYVEPEQIIPREAPVIGPPGLLSRIPGQFKHYTSGPTLRRILESGGLKAKAGATGREPTVWVTDRSMSRREVLDRIFHGGRIRGRADLAKGTHVIGFDLAPHVKLPPTGNPLELIHRGDLQVGRDILVRFAGPNPIPEWAAPTAAAYLLIQMTSEGEDPNREAETFLLIPPETT